MPQVEAWEQHRATTAPAELIWEDATWEYNILLLYVIWMLIWYDATLLLDATIMNSDYA